MIVDRAAGIVAASFNPALMLGALLFDSGEAQRRLEPLPAGWYIASEALLTRWCESAVPIA